MKIVKEELRTYKITAVCECGRVMETFTRFGGGDSVRGVCCPVCNIFEDSIDDAVRYETEVVK